MIGKQNKWGDETIERKKKPKKVKKVKKQVTGDKSRMSIDFDKLIRFDKLKIMPPTNVTQIDETIKQLEEKKKFFLDKREEEKKSFENKGSEEKKEEQDDDQDKPKGPRHQVHKKIEMNQEEFPDL